MSTKHTPGQIMWYPVHPDAKYSTHRGVDAEANQFFESASGEIFTCRTTAGGYGQGWTPDEALANARKNEPHNAPDLLAQRDELVEALNRIISTVGDVERRNHALNEFADVRSIARAALAKVKG